MNLQITYNEPLNTVIMRYTQNVHFARSNLLEYVSVYVIAVNNRSIR